MFIWDPSRGCEIGGSVLAELLIKVRTQDGGKAEICIPSRSEVVKGAPPSDMGQ